MVTLDIKDLYVNIPIKRTLDMVENLSKMNNINTEVRKEYKIFLHTILNQH
jgi:hypothetical protein